MKKIFEIRKKLKSKFRSRYKMFGGWISFSHPSITEIFSSMDVDFVAIDMEHSTINLDQSQRIIAASQSNGVPCLPRPVSKSNDYFKPILDSGADGLIVTTVEDLEDVGQIIEQVKFPNIGKRTYGVNRAHNYGFSTLEYYNNWNSSSSIIAQIETKKGIDNAELILKEKQIDGIMIGPYDLSGSLGIPGEFDNRLYVDACNHLISLSKKYKKSCGTQLSQITKKSIEKNLDYGFNFIVLASDLFVLWDWASNTNRLIKQLK